MTFVHYVLLQPVSQDDNIYNRTVVILSFSLLPLR